MALQLEMSTYRRLLHWQDVQQRVLRTQIRMADYVEALQNFPSPLNYSHILGELL